MNIEQDVLIQLKKYFPDKIYSSLGDIQSQHPILHNLLKQVASNKGTTPHKYLKSLGFISNAKATNKGGFSYDVNTMTKLINNYYDSHASKITKVFFANFLSCSKNNINLKFQKGINFDINQWIRPMDDFEITMICDILSKRRSSFASEELTFEVLTKLNDATEKAIILRHNNTIKVIFDLPYKIKLSLSQNDLDFFIEAENNSFRELDILWENQGKKMSDSLRIVDLEDSIKHKFKTWADAKSLSLSEYLALRGFAYLDKRLLSDDEILTKIAKYADKEKNIHLHAEDEDYHFFASRAYRSNQYIEDFFASYGYKYNRGCTYDVANTREKHKRIISERYIVRDNFIYISSYDQYYGTLHSYARFQGMQADEFIHSLGFIRIHNLKDLPPTYIPYDYNSELSTSSKLEDDNIAVALSKLSSKNHEVYLDVSSYLYFLLFLQSKIKK